MQLGENPRAQGGGFIGRPRGSWREGPRSTRRRTAPGAGWTRIGGAHLSGNEGGGGRKQAARAD
jgi:hypothetical protein